VRRRVAALPALPALPALLGSLAADVPMLDPDLEQQLAFQKISLSAN
jgi:hypothetical protein